MRKKFESEKMKNIRTKFELGPNKFWVVKNVVPKKSRGPKKCGKKMLLEK